MFLMASIIVIAILLSLSALYSQTRASEEDILVKALAEEIKYELAKTIDYTILNNKNTSEFIQNLTLIYAQNHPDKDIAVFYGHKNASNMIYYKKGLLQNTPIGNYTLQEINTGYGKTQIQLDERFFYVFNLTKGQNIFVIVKKEQGDEVIVTAR